MEKYLKDDYGVIVDTKELKSEKDIVSYFEDFDIYDLQRGVIYPQKYRDWIAKIGKNFYVITLVYANNDNHKGVFIENIFWEKIPKPLPKKRKSFKYCVNLTNDKKCMLNKFLKENNISYDVEKM